MTHNQSPTRLITQFALNTGKPFTVLTASHFTHQTEALTRLVLNDLVAIGQLTRIDDTYTRQ